MNIFRSLRYRNFKLFFTGQSISLMGTWMQKTAIAWLVYKITGSPFLLGAVTFASLIPTLLLSPFAGSYIDRHDRFKIMVNSQILALIQAVILAVVIFFQYYNITLILLLSLAQGIINAFDVTCRQSLMIEMVDDPEDLPNAIALNSTMTNMARIIGPALAGFVLSAFGEDSCFAANFLSYIPVLICLYMMKMDIKVKQKPQTSLMTELKEGFSYIFSSKDLLLLIFLLTVSSLFVIPYNTLMPIMAKDIFHGSANTFSLFESAMGLGSVISAIYLANLTQFNYIIKITVYASIGFGLSVIGLSITNQLPVALLLMTFSGIGMMAQTSAINTYIQTHAAPHMRARAISYYIMAYQGVIPIGSLMVGMFSEYIGVKKVLAIEGIIGLLSVVIFGFYWKKLHTDQKQNAYDLHTAS